MVVTSPVIAPALAAGVMALYLQDNPEASVQQVRGNHALVLDMSPWYACVSINTRILCKHHPIVQASKLQTGLAYSTIRSLL